MVDYPNLNIVNNYGKFWFPRLLFSDFRYRLLCCQGMQSNFEYRNLICFSRNILKVKLKERMMFSLLNYRPIGLWLCLSHLHCGFILNKRQVWDSQSNILDEKQAHFGHRYFDIRVFTCFVSLNWEKSSLEFIDCWFLRHLLSK